MNSKKTYTEKKFAQWKEYGEQFTEKEKASYVNGYKRAIQDIMRLARGGKEARLVRDRVMRDTVRAVVEASAECGINAVERIIREEKHYCEQWKCEYGCPIEEARCPSAESCCSVEDGIPYFDETLETIQTESINTHRQ